MGKAPAHKGRGFLFTYNVVSLLAFPEMPAHLRADQP